MPLNTRSDMVSSLLPELHVVSEIGLRIHALAQALTGQDAQFDKPGAVLGRVMPFNALTEAPGLWRGEGLVERVGAMSVEVILVFTQFDGVSIKQDSPQNVLG